MSIRGKVQKGLGESQNTIKEQLPYFRECFPEVADCKPGTINILLEQPLVIVAPDFTTQPLPWHPAFKVVKGGETFQFVRVRLKIDGLSEVKAWVYRAQFSPYRQNPFYVEIVAPPLDFKGQPGCSLEIVSKCHQGIVVIGQAQLDKTPKPTPQR
jgi:CTP-dependent riboflavin kinase